MEQKKADRRVAKTKRAIYSAFAELLSQRELDDITICDIVDIADINRKTFYNYYSGIHALLDEIENSIVQTFEDALGDTDFREAMNHPDIVFEKLTAIVNSNIDFYGHLISMKSNASLITKIVDLLKEKTKGAVAKQSHKKERRGLQKQYPRRLFCGKMLV
jgi:Transcriptional regulator